MRSSERKVREEIYKTLANLIGHGLSVNEACKSVCEVANGIFDRKWKEADSDEYYFDLDTLPDKRRISLSI